MNTEYIVFVENENVIYEFNTYEEVVSEFGSDFITIWNSEEGVFNVVIPGESFEEILDYWEEKELPENNILSEEL